MAEWQNTGIEIPIASGVDYYTASYNDKIYFIIPDSTYSLELDISTKQFSNIPGCPEDVEMVSCIACKNHVFLIGIKVGAYISGQDRENNHILQIYSIQNRTWTNRYYPDQGGYVGVAADEDGGNVYFVGGRNSKYLAVNFEATAAIYYIGISGANISSVYKLSVNLPSARSFVGCSYSEGKLYCIGGNFLQISPYGTIYFREVNTLDLSELKWSSGSVMPANVQISPRSSNIYKDEIFTSVSISFGIYNTKTNSWRLGPTSETGSFANTELVGDYLYAPIRGGILKLSLISATIANPSPSSGFINEKASNVFSWTLESNASGTTQLSATFQWRIPNSSNINTVNVGITQSTSIPANTFPNGSIEWRVSAKSSAGITTEFTDWFLLTTIDEKPNKPTGLYPNTGSRDGTKTIQFSWIHNAPMSTPQSAFELQITYDGGGTWKVLSNKVATATTQFTAAANTIAPTDPTGRIGWRVRTYNSDNVASDWSDTAFFIVHPAPQVPNWISVETGRARPLCRWTSLGQVGYQLQVTSGEAIVFDSGEIHGSGTEYRITDFLNNGIFIFRVRIKNIRGLFSEWANRSVSINAPHRLNITLQGETVENGAQLTFDVEVRASG